TGFTLTVLNPDGTIATDFVGTVYVYGYTYFGSFFEESMTTYDPETYADGYRDYKWIPVVFTADDQGVKTDELIFILSGMQCIGASTLFPTNIGVYGAFQLDWQVLNGLSNELIVLPGEPARIFASIYFSPPTFWNSINNNNAIVQCAARLDDAFRNRVSDQQLKFDFWITGDITSVAYNRTDVRGYAKTFGPQLPVTKDQIVAKATVSAPGTNVPPKIASRTRYALPSMRTFTFMNPVTPVTVFPNQDNQSVSDVSVTLEGTGFYFADVTDGYFEIVLPLRLDQAKFSANLPSVTGSGQVSLYNFNFTVPSTGEPTYNYLGGTVDLTVYDTTYSADRTSLNITFRNTTPVSTEFLGQLINNGSVSFTQINANYTTSGLKVDVPASLSWVAYGEINAVAIPFHSDYNKYGRDYYNAASGIIAIVENLQHYSYQSTNRVILQDADNIANGLLYPYYFPTQASPTVFYANATAATNPGTVNIQSFKKDGTPFTDGQGVVLPESFYENVPLSATVWRYVFRSEPLIAVNYYPPATDAIKTQSGTYTFEAGSVVRADGTSKSQITITLKDTEGLPLPNQSIGIVASNGAIFEPAGSSLTTDANGIATVGLKSAEQGTKTVTATIDQTALTAQVLFIQDVIPVLAESGGTIKITCPTFSPANQERVLDVEGVEIYVKPEGETEYILADGAFMSGTAPHIELRFATNSGIINFGEIAVTIDDGSDETSVDRPIDWTERYIR
ncbi:Ig-like domain-containing protein, partial [Candidatus Pacearchaeota archaeon]|nr:Ig-like domain-containing protein [Candidatus Pacearchaeota archaeon]